MLYQLHTVGLILLLRVLHTIGWMIVLCQLHTMRRYGSIANSTVVVRQSKRMQVLLLLVLWRRRSVITREPGWMYTLLLIRHTPERGRQRTVACHFVCILPAAVEVCRGFEEMFRRVKIFRRYGGRNVRVSFALPLQRARARFATVPLAAATPVRAVPGRLHDALDAHI